MNFILDMPVSPSLCSIIEKFNYTGIHLSKIGMSTASDSEILLKARKENSIIITADLDFPRILALSVDKGPGLILFRGGNYSDKEMRVLLNNVLERIDLSTLKNSICVVDKTRIRITRLPVKKK